MATATATATHHLDYPQTLRIPPQSPSVSPARPLICAFSQSVVPVAASSRRAPSLLLLQPPRRSWSALEGQAGGWVIQLVFLPPGKLCEPTVSAAPLMYSSFLYRRLAVFVSLRTLQQGFCLVAGLCPPARHGSPLVDLAACYSAAAAE